MALAVTSRGKGNAVNMAERSVRSLILRARAYDSKEQIDDFQPDPDSAELDSVESMLTGDRDPIRDEIRNWIDGLDEESQVELVALYWIGRGDFDGNDFIAAVKEAQARRSSPTAGYLLGVPMLGDYLEAGLDAVIEADVFDDA
tara:strand:- start:93328 stop:93759 length:432 start_codon:yes stop_codon:yes gene_type:complete